MVRMFKNTILLFILACFCLPVVAQEIDQKEKDLIMPKQLIRASLPKDYDKRIETYFNTYYSLLKSFDPNRKWNRNFEQSNNFFDQYTLEEQKEFIQSEWILMNKYPLYFSEYMMINGGYKYDDESLSRYSIASYLYQKNGITIKDRTNFYSCFDLTLISKLLLHNKGITTQPLNHIWIVGEIESYSFGTNNDKTPLVLNIRVHSSLGGNYLKDTTLKVATRIEGSFEKCGLKKNTLYLIPLFDTYIIDDYLHNLNNTIYYYTFFSEIREIKNNTITLNPKEKHVKIDVRWGDIANCSISYLLRGRDSITVDEADNEIWNYLNFKN